MKTIERRSPGNPRLVTSEARPMILDIVRRYRPLTRSIARAFMRKLPRTVLREDLEQAALIGLFDAARKNAQRGDLATEGPGFECYVRQRIRGSIIDELRAQDWLPRGIRGSAADGKAPPVIVRFDDIGGPPGEQYPWEERFASSEPSPEAAAMVRTEHARALLAPLDSRERKVIDLTERQGKRQADVAADLGISSPRISQIHARAIAVMNSHLTGDVAPPPRRGGGTTAPAQMEEARMPLPFAVILPVPSTLPEEGIDLVAELSRYREWMLDQALLVACGNKARAARLLGLNRTTLVEMLKRRNAPETLASSSSSSARLPGRLREHMDAIVAETLDRTGNATETARELGIGRSTVWRRVGALKDRRPVVTEAEQRAPDEAERSRAETIGLDAGPPVAP